MWKDKRIEEVKEFNYLGIKFQRSGNIEEHVKDRIRKANIALNRV